MTVRSSEEEEPVKTIITAIVVSVVISGTASAGVTTLITSRQIKDHTIQMRDISPSAVGQLQGQRGAQGDAGSKGDTGAPGAQGVPGSKGDSGALGAQGPSGPQGPAGRQGPKGEPGESNRLYVRTAAITIPDLGEGDANPTHLALRCEPGDHIVSLAPIGLDPARATWSDRSSLQEGDVYTFSDEEISADYTWHGGVGTDVTLTQRVICSS
jgi:hypothetical protein